MKKLLLSFVFILSVMAVMSQSARQMVLAEDFTSTLCTYCPGCAMGMDDLLKNGKLVAVVESHSNGLGTDPYANTYSNARNSMYNVQAFPTASFDGWDQYTGGNHTTSMYNSYLPIYNNCIALTSPVDMSMVVTNSGLNYTVVVTLTKTDVITSTSNILYFFVTQSHISYNWEGQNHLEHVNRLMVPDANGTAVDFTSGNVQTVTLNFAMNSSWPIVDCEFIAAFQDKDAGQGNQSGTSGGYPIKKFKVYQTIKRGVIDLSVDFTANQTTIIKDSSVTFTSTLSGGYIGVDTTYLWSFPGATPDYSTDPNPTVVYSDCGPHDVMLIVNHGGQIDTVTKVNYIHVDPPLTVQPIPNKNDVSATLYPNPNSGNFKLEMNSLIPKNINIEITNALGMKVYSENGITFSGRMVMPINLNNVPAGVYYMSIREFRTEYCSEIPGEITRFFQIHRKMDGI